MNSILHPALGALFLQNAKAKTCKTLRALRSPRRMAVTIVAAVLGCVWLSQIVLSVFLREPADRDMLQTRLALGLAGFLLFQMLKIVFRKTVEPFEWTPSETQILKTAPISRTALVVYRMATTAISALLKSVCFVLVMIPDLKQWFAGFIGMAFGLCFLELVRIVTEVIIFGIGKQRLRWIRGASAVMVCAMLGTAVANVIDQPGVQEKLASPAAYQFLLAVAMQIAEFTNSGFGALVVYPFYCFSDLILTERFDGLFLQRLLAGLCFVGIAGYAAVMANTWMIGACQRQDRTNLRRLKAASPLGQQMIGKNKRPVVVPYRLRGIGAVAWRQFYGAWNYRASLIVSFSIPIALCCVPMFATPRPPNAALFLVASLLFYSYLLLPAALMLDFRRDVDRMAVLKKLPIESINIVIGQLAAPVVLCSFFQAIVFGIASFSGVASASFLALCWLVIVPMNVLIFASENIIFMLHPYRRNKEGADVLIRSVLTFTGKAIVWALALCLLLIWALACSYLAKQFGFSDGGYQFTVGAIFLAGTTTVVCGLAYACVRCLAKMFERFDPGVDSVAMN